jgi:hypothetical protein
MASSAWDGGRMRIGVKPGQWGWSFDELLAAWSKVETEGFDLLSCFDHVSAAGGPRAQRVIAPSAPACRAAGRRPGVERRPPRGRPRDGVVAPGTARSSVGRSAVPSVRRARASPRGMQPNVPGPLAGGDGDRRCPRPRRCVTGPPWDRAATIVVGGRSERVLAVVAALADAWNASSVEADRFAQLSQRLEGLLSSRRIERQVQNLAPRGRHRRRP